MSARLKPIRWTLEKAASEFSISRVTLAKYVKSVGIIPGDDGKFSTTEICRAIFNDGDLARTALATAQTELTNLKRDKLAEKLVDKDQCYRLWESIVILLRDKIANNQRLNDAEKKEILKDLRSIPIEEYTSKNNSGTDEDDSPDSEPA